jgi:hypothetical protein
MVILDGMGLRRARTLALEHAGAINCCVGDLRWALAMLVLQAIMAIWARGQRSCARLVARLAPHRPQGRLGSGYRHC